MNNEPEKAISFSALIPYKTDVQTSYDEAKAHSKYPFWDQQDDVKNYRDHLAVALIIGIITLFNSITQILFIIHGPEPYKWISLALFLFAQLASFLAYGIAIIIADENYQDYNSRNWWHETFEDYEQIMLCCGGFWLMPLCPIALPIMYYILSKDRLPKLMDDWVPLILSSLPSLAVVSLQAYPQTVVLTLIITSGELNANGFDVLHWSFLSSILSIIAGSVQISSLFEQTGLFLMNIIWLLFDCVLSLTIVSAIFYNDITLTIFYVDIGLYGIWMLMVIIIITIMLVLEGKDELSVTNCTINILPDPDNNWQIPLYIIAGCLMLPISLIFIVCCAVIIISVSLALITPILIYFHLFTFIWFFIMDQFYEWNICPMSIRFMDTDNQWHQRILFEWIKNGINTEERNDRLYSINMVMLDNDNALNAKYKQLYHNIATNIRKSTKGSKESVHQMTSEIDQFFVLKFENDLINDIRDFMGKSSFILKWAVIYFPINRILHCIIPFIIIIYIGSSVKWNIDEIHPFLKGLYGILLILFIICSIMICIGWRALYYHRLILPIGCDSWSNDNWNKFATYTANCHYYITALKVVVDWCENNGGEKYIGYVIMNLCGVSQTKKN